MKTTLFLIAFVIVMIWLAGPSIQFKPFKFSFQSWAYAIGIFCFIAGFIFIRYQGYAEGLKKGATIATEAFDSSLKQAVVELKAEGKLSKSITLNKAEIQSNLTRVEWAEGLILQLNTDHDGRNSWLMNYGVKDEAKQLREKRNLKWDDKTQSCELSK